MEYNLKSSDALQLPPQRYYPKAPALKRHQLDNNKPISPVLNHRVTERHMARISNNAISQVMSPNRSVMLSGIGQIIMRKE